MTHTLYINEIAHLKQESIIIDVAGSFKDVKMNLSDDNSRKQPVISMQ